MQMGTSKKCNAKKLQKMNKNAKNEGEKCKQILDLIFYARNIIHLRYNQKGTMRCDAMRRKMPTRIYALSQTKRTRVVINVESYFIVFPGTSSSEVPGALSYNSEIHTAYSAQGIQSMTGGSVSGGVVSK